MIKFQVCIVNVAIEGTNESNEWHYEGLEFCYHLLEIQLFFNEIWDLIAKYKYFYPLSYNHVSRDVNEIFYSLAKLVIMEM